MKPDSRLANKIERGDFIVTAEYLPRAGTDTSAIEACASALSNGPTAVNVADNHYGVVMSSLAASVALSRSGIEPVYQITTRDRNRIALQSDLIGAVYLGIKNVLCLSGYHQTLTDCSESANVFDIDSTQLVAIVRKMNDEGLLLDGTKIEGSFSILIGAVANPYLKPLDLNIIRTNKKVDAGANFIQTQAVFDIEAFQQWLEAVRSNGITEKIAILAGVLPLASADKAKELGDTYTDLSIPNEVIDRIRTAGNQEAQKKEGLLICTEIIKKLKNMQGLRGVHILSGGTETIVPELIAATAM
ncbi:methylenetetrahydrofolate reductase [Chloroflexota bacterium]